METVSPTFVRNFVDALFEAANTIIRKSEWYYSFIDIMCLKGGGGGGGGWGGGGGGG